MSLSSSELSQGRVNFMRRKEELKSPVLGKVAFKKLLFIVQDSSSWNFLELKLNSVVLLRKHLKAIFESIYFREKQKKTKSCTFISVIFFACLFFSLFPSTPRFNQSLTKQSSNNPTLSSCFLPKRPPEINFVRESNCLLLRVDLSATKKKVVTKKVKKTINNRRLEEFIV